MFNLLTITQYLNLINFLVLFSDLAIVNYQIVVSLIHWMGFSFLIDNEYFLNKPSFLIIHLFLINLFPLFNLLLLIWYLSLLVPTYVFRYRALLYYAMFIWVLILIVLTIFILYFIVIAYLYFDGGCELLFHLITALLV